MKQFFLVLMSIFSLFLFFSCQSTQKLELSQKRETENTHYYEIEIEKPLLKDSVPYAKKINAHIDGIIATQRTSFLKIAREYAEDWGGTHKLPFFVSWKFYQLDDAIFSCLLTVYVYAGGAHGYTMLFPINYDLETGEEITIDTLPLYIGKKTKKNEKILAEFLEVASRLSKPKIFSQVDTKHNTELAINWIEEGLEPKKENFSYFTLTEKNLIFHFAEYQLAPYYYGRLEASIPYKKF